MNLRGKKMIVGGLRKHLEHLRGGPVIRVSQLGDDDDDVCVCVCVCWQVMKTASFTM